MKKKWIAMSVAVVLIALSFMAFDMRLKVVKYAIESEKVQTPTRIVFVADLHSCKYGENQSELIAAVEKAQPDVVLLGGDIFEESMPHDNSLIFVEEIAKRYPCYSITGNHDFWSGDVPWLKTELHKMGVKVLEGECVEIGDTGVQIVGVDDPTNYGAGAIGYESMIEQLDRGFSQAENEKYTVLLSHRPELIQTYLRYEPDLVLSGHAHGGQIRIPLVLNGLWAPDQGWLPEYAGGAYKLENTNFVVSRGLARESIDVPRVFNRPELVIVDII